MQNIGRSIAIVAIAVVAFWALGRVAGFHMSLGLSLVMSIVLTLVLNLVLGAFSRRR